MKHTPTFLSRFYSPLKPFIFFILVAMSILSLCRLGLGIWQGDRIQSMSDWITLLGFGARMDSVTIAMFIGIPAVISLLISGIPYLNKVWDVVCKFWLMAVLSFFIFMEASTPAFIMEYSLRPNRLFVEYLIYPKEVFSMLWTGHKLTLFLSSFISAVSVFICFKLFINRSIISKTNPKWFERPFLAAFVLLLAVAVARSSLQHRPINPSFTAFTNDPLVNSLTLNSAYSVLYAVKGMKNEISSFDLYPKMPKDEIVSNIRKSMGIDKQDFVSDEYPTLHKQTATNQYSKPKNLVIILEESLGAQFVKSLGGLDLTPYYDELAQEAWSFERLYATGTRSVRGIEAVVTGFVPTPARSVVKLPKSQSQFFTLAKLLKNKNFDTSFIYGGGAHFDNMSSFFIGNGFNQIIEEKHYKNPVFKGSWGVSDEDLFDMANQTFIEKSKQDKPFFSVVFSSSNHDPYEFPDNRIELNEEPKNTRNNAVKYADYALGKFFEKAKNTDYWDDTVFLVVADHDARLYKANLVPISNFHIPGLIIGKDIKPLKDKRIASHIDLAPTLLSLIGLDSIHPMIGRDFTRLDKDYTGRAMMQFAQNQAYMQGNDVVILQPEKAPKSFKYIGGELVESAPHDKSLINEAIAHPLMGSWFYNDVKYDIPK